MANLAVGLQKLNVSIGRGVNRAKKAVDKVLWGSVNNVTSVPAPGTIPTPPDRTRTGSFMQSGLFNVLDNLLTVDICSVLDYIYNTNVKIPRKRKDNPSKAEKFLYDLQDAAALTRQAIDSFYAFPNEVLTQLQNPNPQGVPAPGTTAETEALPATELSGTRMQKYNYQIVADYASAVLTPITATIQAAGTATAIAEEGLLDAEVQAALRLIPNFNRSINAITDFTTITTRYGDFRQIPNDEFQKLLKKLDDIRGVCVMIEGFSLGSAIALAENFIGSDIRSQIAKLTKFIDPKKLIPTLKDINKALRSFIGVCRSMQAYVRVGRGIIKIVLLLIKIFRFIKKFIVNDIGKYIPLQFVNYTVVGKIENGKEKVDKTLTQVEKFLTQVNQLLSIIITVIQYLLQNTQALLDRVQKLVATLESCPSMVDSSILDELKSTQQTLIEVQAELQQIISDYESNINPDQVQFQQYTIRIVSEELVDEGVTTPRRRGIALDNRGVLVAQSDLTFASLDSLIYEETKIKLISLGLAEPELDEFDTSVLQALKLVNNEVNMEDLNIPASALAPDTDFKSYINSLPNSKSYKRKLRSRLKNAKKVATNAIKTQVP